MFQFGYCWVRTAAVSCDAVVSMSVCEGKAGTQIIFERDGHEFFVQVGSERQDAPLGATPS